MKRISSLRIFTALALVALLGACATPPGPLPAPRALPAQWLNTAAAPAHSLAPQWWQALGDPAIGALVEQAWNQSPTLAQARARLSQSQAQRQASQAALSPSLTAQADAMRGAQPPTFAAQTTAQWALQARWELDLFGAARAQRDAADQRAQSAALSVDDARTTLAVEVVQAYLAWRHAQGQALIAARDVQLAEAAARADAALAQAGLLSAAQAALSQTVAANARVQAQAWQEQMGAWLQSLALLCATDAAEVARAHSGPPQPLPAAPALAVTMVPGDLLSRRPDLAAAHRQWLAAAWEARGTAIAQYAPQLSFAALVGRSRWEVQPSNIMGSVWSLAPSLSLPVWDAGARAAQTQAADAAEALARASLEAQWRGAVAEVEQALLRWQAASQRRQEAEATLQQWRRIDEASAAQARAGLVSGQTRVRDERNALATRSAALDAAREHIAAWLQLVRAMGGGWQDPAAKPNVTATTSATTRNVPPISS
ncbi:TolC family protein [Roseateles sp.]|jgi:multidrug efflux system outer membrane protein|uniref:TolC family protein n=1 Tax=Roseateles sp. TaxID=1971397 RepID=UPI0037C95D4C